MEYKLTGGQGRSLVAQHSNTDKIKLFRPFVLIENVKIFYVPAIIWVKKKVATLKNEVIITIVYGVGSYLSIVTLLETEVWSFIVRVWKLKH